MSLLFKAVGLGSFSTELAWIERRFPNPAWPCGHEIGFSYFRLTVSKGNAFRSILQTLELPLLSGLIPYGCFCSKPIPGNLLQGVYMQTGIYILEPPVLKEGTLFKVYINIYTKYISKCTHVCRWCCEGNPEMLHCSVEVRIYPVVCRDNA